MTKQYTFVTFLPTQSPPGFFRNIAVFRLVKSSMPNQDIYSEYSFLLEKTNRRIKQYAQKKFNEFDFGVTVDQWMVLKQLYPSSDKSQSELAEATFKGTPTLTRIIDLLCAKELTERVVDGTDRRKSQVVLTPHGRAKVEEMLPKVSQIRKAAWKHLSEDDFQHFRHVLTMIYQNLQV